jgi:hypothetical protein
MMLTFLVFMTFFMPSLALVWLVLLAIDELAKRERRVSP